MAETTETTEAKEPCVVQSKEYWLILYLIKHYPILNIECKEDERGTAYLLWTFPPDAAKDEKKYDLGEEMLMNIHETKSSAEIFKRQLQRFKIR